jgi:hypothetical protein
MHPLIAHEWLYGLTECLHITGFAIAVGATAIVDLQLAGILVPKATPAAVLREMAPWTAGGILLAVASGIVILSTDLGRYLAHPTMQFKLVLLSVAVLFNYTWHSRVAGRTSPGRAARLVAISSLLLWSSVIFAGLFYAFT